MGLAGPRKRRKIGDDPNNTTWANSTTGFGHKIMAAQGWTPGSYLGATDAAHAIHYSAANASHIRVSLKEDNLGLGAKQGQADVHNFGLLGFQDLLGRLNGKSEATINKEQAIRADLGRQLWAEQKWGPSRFVRGGYLVGEKIEVDAPPEEVLAQTAKQGIAPSSDHGNAVKVDSGPLEPIENDHIKLDDSIEKKTDKKEKRRKQGKGRDNETKAERRQRKLEKQARKEAEQQVKFISSLSPPVQAQENSKQIESKSNSGDKNSPIVNPGGRTVVRQRYIKQKRMASMNPQALKEILMIKS